MWKELKEIRPISGQDYEFLKNERRKTMNPKYNSKTFSNVVIKNGSYKGWRTIYVGNGRMIFAKGDKRINVQESYFNNPTWMKECWELLITKINKKKK